MTSSRRIYLDGNSLGPPAPGTAEAIAAVVRDEWDGDLIGAWNDREWWDLPVTVGEQIAPLIGAASGQVVVGDSTTVSWFKAVGAALRLRPDRNRIVTQAGGFPTDRHVLDALGAEVAAVEFDQLGAALDDQTAVLAVSHVDYRTGRRVDLPALTAAAHDHGAIAVWDLCHSVGAMDLHVDDDSVDLAVGCTYKYLNGGPGSPAFTYVADRHLDRIDQPIPGWVGHADPFSMSEVHLPADGIRRMLSGTPSVLALRTLEHALHQFDGIDLADLRRIGERLTERAIAQADELGLEVITPRDPSERGSHVSLRREHTWEVMQALIAEGVIGDVRPPDIVRLGFAPLYITDRDVDDAFARLAEVLRTESWHRWLDRPRPTVT